MNVVNVAFFGTSDRSIPILTALRENFNLSLCITREDTKFGREQILKPTEVKIWAKENNVNCITISRLDTQSTQGIINSLKTAQIDTGIVADFSFILPEELINTPKFKLINIHFSLLPKYRGASPVQQAILNGDETTGITYYIMDKGMDTGAILQQVEYKIPANLTAGELYQKLFVLAAQKLPQVVNDYVSQIITPLPQDNARATYTYSKTHPKNTFIYKEDAKIDWNAGAAQIERQTRAYNPWPIAWTTLGDLKQVFHVKPDKNENLKVKIFEATVEKNELNIKKIQVEGGKVLSWKEFTNGYLFP